MRAAIVLPLRRGFALLLAIAALITACGSASAREASTLERAVTVSGGYLTAAVPAPQVGSIGGEWAVIALARSGYPVPEDYYKDYGNRVETYLKACGGVLHPRKYTEYARLVIALTAIGRNPADMAGYNLLTPLGDYQKVTGQGLIGSVWALLALDSGGYPMPNNAAAEIQATRQGYVEHILSYQLENGGWSLTTRGGAGEADPDMTAMALQALARYRDHASVAAAVDRGLACLSALQDGDGGFSGWGVKGSESCAQVLIALCELDIPLTDPRFVKDSRTVLDALMSFQSPDGSFRHTESDTESNQMATEQGLCALSALWRTQQGRCRFYSMEDTLPVGGGLPGKFPEVAPPPVSQPNPSFSDVREDEYSTAIQALASRGIVNGMGDGSFAPQRNMTRAEFAAIVVRALGLSPQSNSRFKDVAPDRWYAPYIGTASAYGIVTGVSDTRFAPEGIIRHQEAAVMVTRAARLCGMDTEVSSLGAQSLSAANRSSTPAALWAEDAVAFCFRSELLSPQEEPYAPELPILRWEVAQLLYNLLCRANLIV